LNFTVLLCLIPFYITCSGNNKQFLDWFINTEKVVTVEEFEEMIKEGWQYVATLPNDKILVKNSRGS